ncbi:HIG1 domain-containing protein [Novosphingobium sp. MW5]|nr:HIG1 domain-containing protein [Novosphingobium sp. MW5]
MIYLLLLLIAGFAIAAATSLIRGLAAFTRDAEKLAQSSQETQDAFGIKQNRMMTQRVLFQAAAVLLIVLFCSLVGPA